MYLLALVVSRSHQDVVVEAAGDGRTRSLIAAAPTVLARCMTSWSRNEMRRMDGMVVSDGWTFGGTVRMTASVCYDAEAFADIVCPGQRH